MLVKLFLVDCWQLKKGKERNESDDASRCLEDGFQMIMRGGEKVNSHTRVFSSSVKTKIACETKLECYFQYYWSIAQHVNATPVIEGQRCQYCCSKNQFFFFWRCFSRSYHEKYATSFLADHYIERNKNQNPRVSGTFGRKGKEANKHQKKYLFRNSEEKVRSRLIQKGTKDSTKNKKTALCDSTHAPTPFCSPTV